MMPKGVNYPKIYIIRIMRYKRFLLDDRKSLQKLILMPHLKLAQSINSKAPEIIKTNIPHYFVIVAIDEDDIHSVLCTTKREKKEEYFRNAKLDLIGLVYIKNDTNNGLSEESWVNCNDTYPISREDLVRKKKKKVY